MSGLVSSVRREKLRFSTARPLRPYVLLRYERRGRKAITRLPMFWDAPLKGQLLKTGPHNRERERRVPVPIFWDAPCKEPEPRRHKPAYGWPRSGTHSRWLCGAGYRGQEPPASSHDLYSGTHHFFLRMARPMDQKPPTSGRSTCFGTHAALPETVRLVDTEPDPGTHLALCPEVRARDRRTPAPPP